MDAEPPKERDREARELKVKVPLAMHVHLHSMKILTGRSISDVVTAALADYFDADGANPFDTPVDARRPAHRPADARDPE